MKGQQAFNSHVTRQWLPGCESGEGDDSEKPRGDPPFQSLSPFFRPKTHVIDGCLFKNGDGWC